jgi:hypothetical protein
VLAAGGIIVNAVGIKLVTEGAVIVLAPGFNFTMSISPGDALLSNAD